MGKLSNSSHGESNRNETKVVLHVYDLTHINKFSYWFGLGVYHSGIEVHGKEYGFGSHEFPVSGVFEVEPKNCPGFAYRRSISLGSISIPLSEFTEFIENIASQYHGNSYNLVSKNCNHFTDDVARKLTGKSIPGWVNRLARLGVLFRCILPKRLHATKVKKVTGIENGTETPSIATATPNPTGSSETNKTKEKKLSLHPKSWKFVYKFCYRSRK